MNSLKHLVKSEAVRLYLYTVASAVIAFLVFLGVLNADGALYVSAIGTAVLAVPVTEATRSAVYSTNTFQSTVDAALATPVPAPPVPTDTGYVDTPKQDR